MSPEYRDINFNPPPHDGQNVMADEMWRSNVRINSKMYHDHYIRFNSMVSTNPAIISIAYLT
jgi:hypothetical protein